jgi:hypothetical protein
MADTEKGMAERKKQRFSIEDAAKKIMNRKRASGEISDICSSRTGPSIHEHEKLTLEVQDRLNSFHKVSHRESQLELESPLGSPLEIPTPGGPVEEISKLLQSGKIREVLEFLQTKFSLKAHKRSNLDMMLQENYQLFIFMIDNCVRGFYS